MGGGGGQVLLIFILEVFDEGIENVIGGYRVVVIEMVVSSCFCMDVEMFYCIETFFLNM